MVWTKSQPGQSMEKKKQMSSSAETAAGDAIGFKPLYAQVREQLMRRLVDGVWLPGMLLPSEMELARQLNVSQGTVRKALDSMTADNLVLRRQGRGTYVAEPEESRMFAYGSSLNSFPACSPAPPAAVLSSSLEPEASRKSPSPPSIFLNGGFYIL